MPITSSHIESTIKQINRRVKGSEKFWDEGAEPLLQLTADHISETNDFDRFWSRRLKITNRDLHPNGYEFRRSRSWLRRKIALD